MGQQVAMVLLDLAVIHTCRTSFQSLITNSTHQGFAVWFIENMLKWSVGQKADEVSLHMYLPLCQQRQKSGAILSQNTKILGRYCYSPSFPNSGNKSERYNQVQQRWLNRQITVTLLSFPSLGCALWKTITYILVRLSVSKESRT